MQGHAGKAGQLEVAKRLSAGALAIAVSGAGAAIQPASGAASPSGPRCGAIVSQDLTLHRDLTNCHGIGLVIDADGVTLDLNGHTVSGDGEADYEGIQVMSRHAVTIMNGVVRTSSKAWSSSTRVTSGPRRDGQPTSGTSESSSTAPPECT